MGTPKSKVKGEPWRNGSAPAALAKPPGCRKGTNCVTAGGRRATGEVLQLS